jgi:hypothetical protein
MTEHFVKTFQTREKDEKLISATIELFLKCADQGLFDCGPQIGAERNKKNTLSRFRSFLFHFLWHTHFYTQQNNRGKTGPTAAWTKNRN